MRCRGILCSFLPSVTLEQHPAERNGCASTAGSPCRARDCPTAGTALYFGRSIQAGVGVKVFFSPHHAGHRPGQTFRHGRIVANRDLPARADNILAALRADGHALQRASAHGLKPVAAIHTPEYLDFLETAWREWRKIDGASEDVFPYIFPVRGMDNAYPSSIVGRAGYHMHDCWAPIGEHTWTIAVDSANLAVEAASQVTGGEAAAYALCRPSGHHAFADMGGGNCFLNNAAIAAQHLRGSYARVALIDVDVHHGNGSQGIFYRRDDVLFVSLHRDPVDYHPYFAGHAHERGEGRGLGFNLNLPLRKARATRCSSPRSTPPARASGPSRRKPWSSPSASMRMRQTRPRG